MERGMFERGIGALYGYFQRKKPEAFVIERWFKKIEENVNIPNIALPWIFGRLEDEEGIPKNIPVEFKKLWYLYRKAHPEKSIKIYEPCKECGSTGMIHFRILSDDYDPAMMCSYLAICKKCNNSWKQFGKLLHEGGYIKETGVYVDPVLRATNKEVMDAGGIILNPENPYAPKVIHKPAPEVKFHDIPQIQGPAD